MRFAGKWGAAVLVLLAGLLPVAVGAGAIVHALVPHHHAHPEALPVVEALLHGHAHSDDAPVHDHTLTRSPFSVTTFPKTWLLSALPTVGSNMGDLSVAPGVRRLIASRRVGPGPPLRALFCTLLI